mmetsp:Transcript_15847/g.61783  ORF Transcript_15847/g.61783 Transcript_15847/m.61783 type:complete len:268 (-) Transcript_15847:40-843(-)
MHQLQELVPELRHQLRLAIHPRRGLVPNLAMRRLLARQILRLVLVSEQTHRPQLLLVEHGERRRVCSSLHPARLRRRARPVAVPLHHSCGIAPENVQTNVAARRVGVRGARAAGPRAGPQGPIARISERPPHLLVVVRAGRRGRRGLGGCRAGRVGRRREPPAPALVAHLADAVRVAERQASLRALAQATALWTLVKFFVVPRGREAPAAVRHVEACPAGAALLGEVGISSRERAPALVARPLRGFLSDQVGTRHRGQWAAREGNRA